MGQKYDDIISGMPRATVDARNKVGKAAASANDDDKMFVPVTLTRPEAAAVMRALDHILRSEAALTDSTKAAVEFVF